MGLARSQIFRMTGPGLACKEHHVGFEHQPLSLGLLDLHPSAGEQAGMALNAVDAVTQKVALDGSRSSARRPRACAP